MKDIAGKWIGMIRGTNNGTVFAELFVKEGHLFGSAHINDPMLGVGVYTVKGAREAKDCIRLVLTPDKKTHLEGHGIVTVLARMPSSGNIMGEWRSTIGTAGTLDVAKMDSQLPHTKQSTWNTSHSSLNSIMDVTETSHSKRVKVFVSYSHCDESWLLRLRVHLRPLERVYALDIWDDSKVVAGSRWHDEIDKAIQSAKVAVLIISADFLATDFIINNELPPLLDAARNDGAVIMPLIASPSRFNSTKSISQFQAVNDPSKPLISLPKAEQEHILVKMSEDIERALDGLHANGSGRV
jgi:hypothetical protein